MAFRDGVVLLFWGFEGSCHFINKQINNIKKHIISKQNWQSVQLLIWHAYLEDYASGNLANERAKLKPFQVFA